MRNNRASSCAFVTRVHSKRIRRVSFQRAPAMDIKNMNGVPSTPQLVELIKTILPQKIRTTTNILSEFKKSKYQKTNTGHLSKNQLFSCDKVELSCFFWPHPFLSGWRRLIMLNLMTLVYELKIFS